MENVYSWQASINISTHTGDVLKLTAVREGALSAKSSCIAVEFGSELIRSLYERSYSKV
jgi:hypothetical protein